MTNCVVHEAEGGQLMRVAFDRNGLTIDLAGSDELLVVEVAPKGRIAAAVTLTDGHEGVIAQGSFQRFGALREAIAICGMSSP